MAVDAWIAHNHTVTISHILTSPIREDPIYPRASDVDTEYKTGGSISYVREIPTSCMCQDLTHSGEQSALSPMSVAMIATPSEQRAN